MALTPLCRPMLVARTMTMVVRLANGTRANRTVLDMHRRKTQCSDDDGWPGFSSDLVGCQRGHMARTGTTTLTTRMSSRTCHGVATMTRLDALDCRVTRSRQ